MNEIQKARERVKQNRSRRKELMEKGLTYEQACLIVNEENQKNNS